MKRSIEPNGRPVDHHRAMRLVVGADVFQVEALRQVVVELHGAELPFAADAVAHHEVDLRPVERRFARLGGVGHAQALDDFDQAALGVVPILGVADVLVAGRIAEAEADAVIVEAQARQHEQHQLDVGAQLRSRPARA